MITAEGHVDAHKKVTLTAGQQSNLDDLRLFNSDLGFYIEKPAPDVGELAWEPDFNTALERAQSEKRPLLVMMTATWCGPCKMLEQQTLSDAWIRHFLSPFVVVKAYEDREVEKKYGLRGYPTLVFVDSDGKAVHTCVGYMPAFSFAGHCAQALGSLPMDLTAGTPDANRQESIGTSLSAERTVPRGLEMLASALYVAASRWLDCRRRSAIFCRTRPNHDCIRCCVAPFRRVRAATNSAFAACQLSAPSPGGQPRDSQIS